MQNKRRAFWFCAAVICFVLSGCVTKGKIRPLDVDNTGKKEEIREVKEELYFQELKQAAVEDKKEVVTAEIVKEEKPENAIPLKSDNTAAIGVTIAEQKQTETKPAVVTVYAKPKKRTMPNKAFSAGEKYTFAVQYLGITAALAVMEVKEILNYNGHKVYRVVSTVKALPFFNSIHRVDDTVESYIDCEGIFSRKMVKNLKEGGYEKEITLYFDQERNLVKEVEKEKSKVYNGIADYCQDILSAFYYFRTQNIEINKDITVDVHADGKNHKLTVKVQKKEVVKVPLGRYEAFVIKPFMNFETIFKQEGEVTIWCTTDERHVPVLMKSKVFVGSINATLIDAVIPKRK
jgi:ribosomal protein S17E